MAAPIRGTQSFVAIMGQVWDRPSLTALEIAWRWLPAVVILLAALIASHVAGSHGIDVSLDANFREDVSLIRSISIFQPVTAVDTVHSACADLVSLILPVVMWLLPLVLIAWNLIAALGRTLVLRHLDPALHARRFSIFVLGTLRAAAARRSLGTVVLGTRLRRTHHHHLARCAQPGAQRRPLRRDAHLRHARTLCSVGDLQLVSAACSVAGDAA
jgi:hypothetical protein